MNMWVYPTDPATPCRFQRWTRTGVGELPSPCPPNHPWSKAYLALRPLGALLPAAGSKRRPASKTCWAMSTSGWSFVTRTQPSSAVFSKCLGSTLSYCAVVWM